MIYDSTNASGCTVHVLETGEQLKRAMCVDTDRKMVLTGLDPPQFDGDNMICEDRRFTNIWPIFAGSRKPVMFACYGELSGEEVDKRQADEQTQETTEAAIRIVLAGLVEDIGKRFIGYADFSRLRAELLRERP